MIYKLQSIIQNYDWGSKTALKTMFDISNLDQKPQAEMWMGAHPLASSMIEIDNSSSDSSDHLKNNVSLLDIIESNRIQHLGKNTANQYGELPFLLKVLCAEHALSIQVHPSLEAAKDGFLAENNASIELNAFNRNFKDSNHKPELIYALTPFVAMNGFRPFAESAELLKFLAFKDPIIYNFVFSPCAETLSSVFLMILKRNIDENQQSFKTNILQYTKEYVSQKNKCEQGKCDPPYQNIWSIFTQVEKDYPNDLSILSLFILNVITLMPGEAMFLPSQTPHAYIHGTGLEIMANSDNVLRAGLTKKYIDIDTLFENLLFHEIACDTLKCIPEIRGKNILHFSVPVKDFTFIIIELHQDSIQYPIKTAHIIFCISGEVTIIWLSKKSKLMQKNELKLFKGQSCFVSASADTITLNGIGKIACASNCYN